MKKFGWSRVAILQQAEEVFISVSNYFVKNTNYLPNSVFHQLNQTILHTMSFLGFNIVEITELMQH